jgi:Winged helix DNA-binding domain
VHARRLTAQLLAGAPARSAPAVAERLLAIQGQDPRGARLAIRARTVGVDAADIDRELTQERSLVITTLNRGTLHLVRSEDYPLLQSLTTPPLMTASATRLASDGLDAATSARAVDLIDRSIAEEGPLTRVQLRERLARAGIPHLERSLVHLVFRASIEGRIVRGPMVGRQHAFARVSDWLSPAPPPPRETALAELARRYLAGHGPARDRDLARWAGLPLRDARAGLGAIAGELRELPGGLVDLARRRRTAPLPPPRLLGAFEPLLLGWASRADALGADEAHVVNGGVFRNFALVGGRGVAVWRLQGAGVEIEPFAELDADDAAALARDGEAVKRFLC